MLIFATIAKMQFFSGHLVPLTSPGPELLRAPLPACVCPQCPTPCHTQWVPGYLPCTDIARSSGPGSVKDICNLGKIGGGRLGRKGKQQDCTVDLKKSFSKIWYFVILKKIIVKKHTVSMSCPSFSSPWLKILLPPTFSLKTQPPFEASGIYWTQISLGTSGSLCVPHSSWCSG